MNLLFFLLIIVAIVTLCVNLNDLFANTVEPYTNSDESIMICRCSDGAFSAINKNGNCECSNNSDTKVTDYCDVDNSSIFLSKPKYDADYVDIDQVKCEATLQSPTDYEQVYRDVILKTNKPYIDIKSFTKFYDDLY